jgi:hypothetical protein
MITNLNAYLQGCVEKICHGLGKRATVVALGAAVSFGAIAPERASASINGGNVTQLEFIQWIVQVTGESSLFSADSKAADYVNWAKTKGMNPGTGWQPNAKLQRDVLAQALVQLYNLNPKKYGGDFARILAREGIELPTDNDVSRRDLVALLDTPGTPPFPIVSPHSHPNNGHFGGTPPPRNPNGDPHDGTPGHNGHHNVH